MPFKNILSQLFDADLGVRGAIVADWEGEAVDLLSSGGCEDDLKIFAAHQGILLRHFRKMVNEHCSGPIQEVIIRTKQVDWFVFPITSEYYLALCARRSGVPSQICKIAQRCVAQLGEEIEEV